MDLADELGDDVLQCEDPDVGAELVRGDRELCPGAPHLLDDRRERGGFGDAQDGLGQRRHRHLIAVSDGKVQEVLDRHQASDGLVRAAGDWDAGVPARAQQLPELRLERLHPT